MKNNNYLLGLSVFLILVSASCNDEILDKEPVGVADVDGFFQTEADIVVGINGVYELFQGSIWGGAFVHLQPHFDAATDNAVLCCSWEYQFTAIATGTMSPTTGSMVAWKYTYGYQALARINNMIAVIESDVVADLSEESAAQWVGELRFLRGFVYSDMVAVYGGIPIVTTPVTNEEALQLTRNSEEEVVQQIVDDLDFAVANLDIVPNNGQIGRPTMQAALALKGKVLLYQQRWAESSATLGEVIALEGDAVLLDEDYEGLFRGTEEDSKEILFSIQYLTDAGGEGSFLQVHYAPGTGEPGSGWGSFTYTRDLVDAYYASDGLPISESPLYDPNDELANRDPRLRLSFFFPGDTYRGKVLDATEDFTVNGSEVTNPNAYVMRSRKWVSETGNTGQENSPVDLVLLRYADVLMMYAEAQNEAVGPDASVYSAVNKVRARVGMPDFSVGLDQVGMRDEIRHERRVEFAMEGTRYFDLLRWRIAEEVIPSVPNLENRQFDPAKNYRWPIPQSVIDGDSDIEQNPGY